MKWTSLVGLGLATTAYADGVTGDIKPDGNAPEGCNLNYDGSFEVTIGKLDKRAIEKRSCSNPDALLLTLSDGILKDAKGRTGYIASNYQFQLDDPPQEGAIYTAGFSACSNGSLALGSSEVFYQCLSGTFYNLYDRNWAAQCEPIEIIVLPCNGGGESGSGGGQNTVGTQIVQTTVVTAISDGQPQVHTTTVAVPMCQIGDGQVQVHTTPCGSVPAQASPVTQLSEGQPQAPANTVVPPHISQTYTATTSQPQLSTVSAKPSGPLVTLAPNGTGVAPAVPSAPSVPNHHPISSASKALPGFRAALAVALAGILAL